MQTTNELLTNIKRYNAAYRQGTPLVTDAAYDALIDELKLRDPENLWFSRPEPAPVEQGRKRKLPIPMKSLNKVKSLDELKRWAKSLGLPQSTQLVIMPKYDGVSWLHDEVGNHTYSRGGSENEGQDCSEHFNRGGFASIDNFCKFPAWFTFGELVFKRSSWEENMYGRLSDSTGEPYKSPRNTIAGFINREIPTDDIRFASFVRYGVEEDALDNWTCFSGLLDDMSDCLGATAVTALYHVVTVDGLTEDILLQCFKEWSKLYYIDGLVVYINDLGLWSALGRQANTGNPMYAVAYKHPDFTEMFETTVLGIKWQVSKSGALKPVVQIKPVDTGDCVMENPTGHNARWCENNSIGLGSRILVTRSGGVIPKIISTLHAAKPELPRSCPECGADVSWDANHVDLYCTDPMNCEGVKFAKLMHFLETLGMEEMGEETVAKIFAKGFTTPAQFMAITDKDLVDIEGFGDATIDAIVGQIAKLKQGVSLPILMHASDCFKGVGAIKARKFLESITEEEAHAFCNGDLYNDPKYKSWPFTDEFMELPVTQQNIFMGSFVFPTFLRDVKIPYILPSKPNVYGTKYKGCAICFSGVRDAELEDYIISQGGKIASGVSKNTTHLIVKDPEEVTSKIRKARSLGIPVLNIQEFKSI